MVRDEKQQRVDALVAKAKSLADAANIHEAIATLHEASALQPENRNLIRVIDLLQEEGQLDTPLLLVCRYVKDGDEATGRQALEVLARTEQSSNDAQRILEISLGAPSTRGLKDELIGLLFSKPDSRKALTNDILQRPTEIFQALWTSGEASMKGLVNTVLSATVWVTEEDRAKAEKDIFTLLMAKVLEPGLQQVELAMKSIARLLSVDAKLLKDMVEPESFEVILSYLSIENSTSLRSQATLAAAKFLEVSPEQGQKLLTQYVVTSLAKQNTSGRIAAFSAASAIFPVVPQMASKLFLTEGFVSDLTRLGQSKGSATLRRAVLELLSAACIEKSCRESIKKGCEPWLRDLVAEGNDPTSTLSALVLAKITTGLPNKTSKIDSASSDDLVQTLKGMVLMSKEGVSESAIEGLAFRSTDSAVKEELVNDSSFLTKLLESLKTSDPAGSMAFGGLTILSNLTQYPPVLSAEQKRVAQLKAYANQSRPAAGDPVKEDEKITDRCTKVLDAGVGSVLVHFIRVATPTLLMLISNIIASLAKHPKHRGKMAQQGLFDVALRIAASDQVAQAVPAARRNASLALAQMLIRLNPTLLFYKSSGKRSISSTLKALDWLLTPADMGENEAVGKTVNYFPVCEALKAITNMAAMCQECGDDTAIRIILSQSWTAIEGYLESDVSQVRQAATECLCNLCISDDAIKLYVEDEKAEDRQAVLLRQGMFDEEKGVRLAAGGALASILGAGGVPKFMEIKGAVGLLGTLVVMNKAEWLEDRKVDELVRVLAILSSVLVDLEQGSAAIRELRQWSVSAENGELQQVLLQDLQGSPVEHQAKECAALLAP